MSIITSVPNIIDGEIRKIPHQQNYTVLINNDIDLQNQISAISLYLSSNYYNKAEINGFMSSLNSVDANLQSQVTTNKNTMDNHIASTTAHDANNIVLTSENPYLTANNVESGLEQISDRVSTIIAQSGTSSTEVVDSRTSSTYGVFTTLGNRLNSSDIKLKALEDEVETQNVGTLSLTPISSNQSPIDSYNGVIDVEIGGATVNQIIINGGVVSSLTANGTSRLIDINIDGTIEFSSSYDATNRTFDIINGQKYFIVALSSAGTFLNSVSLYYSDATNQTISVAGQTNNPRGIITANKTLKANIKLNEGSYSGTLTKTYIMLINITGTSYEYQTADQINAIFNEYCEGIKSTEKAEINTSDINIFDGFLESGAYSTATGGKLISASQIRSVFPQEVRPLTSYNLLGVTQTGQNRVFYYDGSKNFITTSLVPLTGDFITPSGCEYLTFHTSDILLTQFMLNEGSTPKPYESHKPSQLKIICTNNLKFELSKLPNGKENKLFQMYGYTWAVKLVESEYILKDADIVEHVTTPVNLDWVGINMPSGITPYSSGAELSGSIATTFSVPSNSGFIDSISLIEKHSYGSLTYNLNRLVYAVANGKYANLVAAKADLVGKKIIYQLAIPVLIQYEDFPTYGIECKGMLVSHDNYTNINCTANLTPNVNLEYSRNLGACVDGLSQSMGNIYDIATQTGIDLQTKKQNNLIINGGFDIWQRGTTQTSSGYGSDDRWFNQNIGSTKTHSQQVFTIGQADVPNNPVYFSRTVVSSVAGVGNTCAKWQLIEDVKRLSGKTVSLSFWAKADANKNMSVEFTQSFGVTPDLNSIGVTKLSLTTRWQKFTVTANLPNVTGKSISSASSTAILFWFDAGSNYDARTNSLGQQSGTFDIANVCLVEGGNPQDYQKESVGDAKRQCERYLFDLSGTYRMGFVQADYIAFSIPSLLTKMRANPIIYSVGAVETTNYQLFAISGSPLATGFTLSLPTPSEFRATKVSHGAMDALLSVTSKVFADAEM